MSEAMKDSTSRNKDDEDIFLWSDGTNCYRYEADLMKHMSDDYCVLYFGSDDYNNYNSIEELA